MNHVTALARKGGRPILCLLLALLFSIFQLQAQCPAYPRAYDQAYVCIGNLELTFEQNSAIHNPVRFTLGAIPSDYQVQIDFGDGTGWHAFDSGTPNIIPITYAAEGQYPVRWQVQQAVETCCDAFWGT
ncbi:MAG: hypothetical protein JNJ57_12680 [Saprospiraceae bacterium]|nr:hypothetical protein [Saprospiraceae bacterium]